ncbi:MAG TPA: GxxExxY protein [Terriglobales bacterium]|nr:GxxExxY protein [Terriglobales bacterium]
MIENSSTELKFRELTEKIIGVFYDVYNELGHGFLESIYHECMVRACHEAGLAVERQVAIPVLFRGQQIAGFKADLLVEKRVLLELKSVRILDPAHEAQLLHYLKATEIEVGLLLNFGPHAQFRRLIFDNARKKSRVDPRKSVAKVSA